VSQLRQEYDDLVVRRVQGHREKARASLEELETLTRLEMLPPGGDASEPGAGTSEPLS
jgi:hypothetical protein